MDIGIAFDLKSDFKAADGAPDDRLEEFDSDRTIDGIVAALAKKGHRARRLGGGRRFLEALLREPPELVFNISEGYGTRSREAQVPAVCEMLSIPCTHSDPLTLAVSLDKAMAKRLVATAGVAVARSVVVERLDAIDAVDLPFPLIAKPLFEGSSMGVRRTSKSSDRGALRTEVARLLSGYGEPALIEEFLPGAEFTVGVLGRGEGARVLATMEITPKNGRTEEFVYSVEVKRIWDEQVEYHVPPRRPASLIAAVERVALDAYRALQCRDVGRVDVRLDGAGLPRFIELNPLPGVNPGWSDLCVLAERAGMEYDALIGAILDETLARLKS